MLYFFMEKLLFEHISESYNSKFGYYPDIKKSTTLNGGCINHTIKVETIDGPLFLKWNSNGPDDMFLREAESLIEFQKSNNKFIVFPEPLLAKQIDELPGYLLTTYLQPGQTSNNDENLGRGLAQLHQLSNNQYGFTHNNYCGATEQDNSFKESWIDFYIENRIQHIVRLIRHNRAWDNENQKLFKKYIKRIPDLLNYNTKPALIHGDLWSGNYIYTSQGPALIDPCASYCDREFEMGIMTMFGGFSSTVYDAYNEYYPLEAGWKERNLIYQLYHILNHYFLFGGNYKQQAMKIMKKYL